MTGDTLTPGEHVSWLIQSAMRRWLFLGIITLVTILAWCTNNTTVLTWWNLGASYMALVIESIVGMAMFRQCIRDAVVSRETRAISKHIKTIQQQQAQMTAHMEQIIEQIEQQLTRLTDLEKKTGKLLYLQETPNQ